MSGNLCEHCVGFCCRYIALPIEKPEERAEFDDVRWYLLHDGVSVFVEDGEWYINVATTCRHLQPDYRCGIYETRPQICRNYSTSNCDYHSGDYGWEQHFTCPEHLDAYVAEVFDPEEAELRSDVKPTAKSKRKRPRVKVKRRKAKPYDLATATTDIARVPLPVLGVER